MLMKNNTKLDEFATLIMYFFDNFSHDLLLDKKKPTSKKERIALEVFNRINDISSIFYRLDKYPFYFKNFYLINEINISEAEALEYHIQNYLNDIYALKIKNERLLGLIKNSIKEFNIINEKDIKQAIKHINNNLDRGLKKAQKTRGDHMHDISVSDPKISQAKLNLTIVNFVKTNNIEYADKEKLINKYNELIEESKQKYIKQSEHNCIEFKKLSNFLMIRIGFLLASLYGHNNESFKSLM
jgi:hypothetical protein